MKHLQTNKTPFFKRLTNTFGIGNNLAILIHQKLGLNKRTSPIFVTRKHSRDCETVTNGILIDKKLKTHNSEIRAFERSIRTHRGMQTKLKTNSGHQIQKNDKTNKKK